MSSPQDFDRQSQELRLAARVEAAAEVERIRRRGELDLAAQRAQHQLEIAVAEGRRVRRSSGPLWLAGLSLTAACGVLAFTLSTPVLEPSPEPLEPTWHASFDGWFEMSGIVAERELAAAPTHGVHSKHKPRPKSPKGPSRPCLDSFDPIDDCL